MTDDAANPQDEFPLSKGVLWLICLLATPLCGAVFYYVWRKKHPKAANYANRVSWISWVLWIAVYVLFTVVLK
jgi:hypothetical protein